MLPGIAVHVVHRGNDRQSCFFDDEDRSFYLFHLGRLLPRSGCAVHAYCLMNNHLHLLLTPSTVEACGTLMKGIAQLYAQYINKRYGRSGYLWEGRFKSSLVQSEDYVLACYRYIELNPVRAGMVPRPEDYAWSSYGMNARGNSSSLITPHEQYLALGKDACERRTVYRSLFGSLIEGDKLERIRAALNGGFALGSDAFIQRVSRAIGRRAEKGMPGRPHRGTAEEEQLDLL